MFRLCLPLAALLFTTPALADAPDAPDTAESLARPGVSDLLRAAAAQIDAGELDAARATLSQALGPMMTAAEAETAASAEEAGERMVALYKEGDVALANGDTATARARWEDALALAQDQRSAQFIASMLAMTEVVGKDAGDPTVTKVLQGKVPGLGEGTTLVFFFEPWCPHCQKELPALQARLDGLSARGIEVLGLTRLTRGATDKDVRKLIKQDDLSYPIAVETGETAARFGVDGVPAAAVVQDGTIVWRGHPMQLGDGALDRFATE